MPLVRSLGATYPLSPPRALRFSPHPETTVILLKHLIELVSRLIAALVLSCAATSEPQAQPAAQFAAGPDGAPQEQEDENPPVKPRRISPKRNGGESREYRGVDGEIVLPGVLPKSTSKAAQAAWKTFTESIGTLHAMKSFELEFSLRQRNPDPEVPQVNDMELVFSYLAPNNMRAVLESGRTLLRGPGGDYLIDNQETIKLVGREGAEDKKQIDEMVSIARNFVALADPRSLRLTALTLEEAPPAEVTPRFRPLAESLTWLGAESPDFFLEFGRAEVKGGPPPLYRARIGIDSATQDVRIAIIQEQRAGKLVRDTAILVVMNEYAKRNSLRVPHKIELFSAMPVEASLQFHELPTSTLWLKRSSGRLRAKLEPDDFRP